MAGSREDPIGPPGVGRPGAVRSGPVWPGAPAPSTSPRPVWSAAASPGGRPGPGGPGSGGLGSTQPSSGSPGPGRVGLAPQPPAGPPPGGVTRRRRPRAGYIASCVLAALVLVVSGFAYKTVSDVAGIGSSNAIVSGASTGPQNILLMGIESRRYWNGDILPPRILAKLHAGNAQAVANGVGGNDTNTLILVHIFADGKRAVGFSIPRDDWVQFAGTIGPQQSGKIGRASCRERVYLCV